MNQFEQHKNTQLRLSDWSEWPWWLSQKMRALISKWKHTMLWVLWFAAITAWSAEKIHAQIPVWCTKDIMQDPANNPMHVGDTITYIAPWSWTEMVDAIRYDSRTDSEQNVQAYINNIPLDLETGGFIYPWDTIKRVWLSQGIDRLSTFEINSSECPNNDASFDLDVIDQILPLNRTRIDAEQVQDSVIVTGQIASRYNAEKATLQASAWAWFVDTDQSIAFDRPDRNTPETLRYAIHTRDLLALLGDEPADWVYYFRVKNNDLDGRVDLSPVVALKIAWWEIFVTTLYPNPCHDFITLKHGPEWSDLGTAHVYDAHGRLVKVVENMHSGDGINMSQEKPWLYFIHNPEKNISQQFIKQ